MCLSPAMEGGASKWVSAVAVHNELLRRGRKVRVLDVATVLGMGGATRGGAHGAARATLVGWRCGWLPGCAGARPWGLPQLLYDEGPQQQLARLFALRAHCTAGPGRGAVPALQAAQNGAGPRPPNSVWRRTHVTRGQRLDTRPVGAHALGAARRRRSRRPSRSRTSRGRQNTRTSHLLSTTTGTSRSVQPIVGAAATHATSAAEAEGSRVAPALRRTCRTCTRRCTSSAYSERARTSPPSAAARTRRPGAQPAPDARARCCALLAPSALPPPSLMPQVPERGEGRPGADAAAKGGHLVRHHDCGAARVPLHVSGPPAASGTAHTTRARGPARGELGAEASGWWFARWGAARAAQSHAAAGRH